MMSGQGFIRSVAVDNTGGVIATGDDNSGGSTKWLTIRYNSAGTELWRKAAQPATGYGVPAQVVLGASGDAYVGGNFYDTSTSLNSSVVIKYDAAGNEEWRRANTATALNAWEEVVAIATAPNGDLVTLSRSFGQTSISDFRIVRYKPNGDEAFHIRIDSPNANPGPGNSSDQPVALAIGSDGAIFAAGNTSVDPLQPDFLVVKLAADGVQQWRASEGDDDRQSAVYRGTRVDPAGNVYVAARAQFGNKSDYMLSMLNPNGLLQWQYYAHGSSYRDLYNLAVDGIGNAVLIGSAPASSNGLSGAGFETIKIDASGNEVWRVSAGASQQGGVDIPSLVEFDVSGNVIVAGYRAHAIDTNQFMTIKYSPTGAELWRAYASKGRSAPTSMALDNAAGIAVAGWSQESPAVSQELMVVKYGASGDEQWRRFYPTFADSVSRLRFDAEGNLFVATTVTGPTSSDFSVAKLDPSGNELWRKVVDSPDQLEDTLEAMAVDSTGNVVLTGKARRTGGVFSAMTVKLSSHGQILWRSLDHGMSQLGVEIMDVGIDSADNIHIAGGAQIPGLLFTALAIKYNADGIKLWHLEPGTTGPTSRDALATVIASNAKIYWAGNSTTGTYDSSLIVAQLAATASSAPLLTQVVSRKTHGQTGVFDLPIVVGGSSFGAHTVEPRGGALGHKVVFQFDRMIQSVGGVQILDAEGQIATTASVTRNGMSVDVSIPTLADNSRVRVNLIDVNGGNNYSIPISFQVGSVTNAMTNSQTFPAIRVTASDISAAKAKIQATVETVNSANFLFDFNVDGFVNQADVSIVKKQSGFSLR
jgi:hypothetical protein